VLTGISLVKLQNPNHVFSNAVRSRVADIERSINIEIHVKSLMIDLDDSPAFPDSTRVDVELLTKLMKLSGPSSNNINNNLSSSHLAY